MALDAPTIYATTVLGRDSRRSGIVDVALGLEGVKDGKAEPVLRLVLPTDAAQSLAEALGQAPSKAVAPAKAPASAKAAGTEPAPDADEAALQNALAVTGLFAFQQLLAFANSDRMFARRLDDFERRLLAKARETAAGSVSTKRDTDAMRAAVESLERIFYQVRAPSKPVRSVKPPPKKARA